MILPILLLAIQQPKITLTMPATRMKSALAILSEATHLRLAASSVYADDVLVANLKDAPADKTLRHLAEALVAKWVAEKDGTMRLVPDADAMRAAEKREQLAASELLDKSLAYLSKRLSEQPDELDDKAIRAYKTKLEAEKNARKAAEAAQDFDRMFLASSAVEETPAWRALARLLPLLDRKELLAMPNDAREVWAERPTPMQHPMPAGSEEVLSQYRREEHLLDPTLEVARVKIVMKKWEHGGAFNAEIIALDASGGKVDQNGARLNADSDQLKISYSVRSAIPALPGEKPIEIPGDARDMRIALKHDDRNPERPALLTKFRGRLLDPIANEPTQWHVAADLLAAAQASGKNLIGTVNDLVQAGFWRSGPMTPNQALKRHAAYVEPSSDGWLVARSTEPVSRVSRPNAAAFLTESVRLGGVQLDSAAAWAGQSPDRYPFVNWIGDYLETLFPAMGRYSVLGTIIDGDSLRIWDALGPVNRAALRNGRTLDLSSMSPQLKAQAQRMAYWMEALDDSKADPTEALPKGINGGSLSLTVSDTPVFYGWSSKEPPPTTILPVDAKGFGTYLAKGNGYFEISADDYRAFDRFRIGKSKAYELRFLLEPGGCPMTLKFRETVFDPSSVPVDRLPEALQAEAEKARLAALAAPATPKKDVIPPR
jgi:hypothetical protein